MHPTPGSIDWCIKGLLQRFCTRTSSIFAAIEAAMTLPGVQSSRWRTFCRSATTSSSYFVRYLHLIVALDVPLRFSPDIQIARSLLFRLTSGFEDCQVVQL